jgi:hypothetical protein
MNIKHVHYTTETTRTLKSLKFISIEFAVEFQSGPSYMFIKVIMQILTQHIPTDVTKFYGKSKVAPSLTKSHAVNTYWVVEV